MTQERIDYAELPEDPAARAEQDTIWWLVNRIRTKVDALETFRIASRCVNAVNTSRSSEPRALKLQAAMQIIGDALETWDSETSADADRLEAWSALDAQLARRARETVRADKAACFHYGRLLFSALREAYGIQKQSNLTTAAWQSRSTGMGRAE